MNFSHEWDEVVLAEGEHVDVFDNHHLVDLLVENPGPNRVLYALLVTLQSSKQVWSLSQFYSVEIPKSRIDVKSAFSTNAQSRFASVVVDDVLGPPRLAQRT